MRACDDVEGTLKDWKTDPSEHHKSFFFMAVQNKDIGDQQASIEKAARELNLNEEELMIEFNNYKKEIEKNQKKAASSPPIKSTRKKDPKKLDPWWDKDTFIPPVLADHIMNKQHFVWDRGELHFYENGIY